MRDLAELSSGLVILRLFGMMENKMETIIILGLYWGLYLDNGKENANCYLGFRV